MQLTNPVIAIRNLSFSVPISKTTRLAIRGDATKGGRDGVMSTTMVLSLAMTVEDLSEDIEAVYKPELRPHLRV
ncbi:hypothetical protein DL769_009261 [Monosporascus sp. CRB-8-3]|nr:hypothetical protein DL769_009261 [Monosporascus sp. CRB-8-3]